MEKSAIPNLSLPEDPKGYEFTALPIVALVSISSHIEMLPQVLKNKLGLFRLHRFHLAPQNISSTIPNLWSKVLETVILCHSAVSTTLLVSLSQWVTVLPHYRYLLFLSSSGLSVTFVFIHAG